MWQIQKKYCCDLRQSVLPMFSSRSYMASALTFRSLPFGFTFVYSVRECSIFIILHVTIQFSWCMQGLFEPFEHLWWVWGLILNAISPLLPPSWGFSVLGHGVSPQSHFSAMQPPGAAHFIYVIISPGLCLFNIIPGLLSYNHCISTANQKFLEKPVTWFHSAEKLQLML